MCGKVNRVTFFFLIKPMPQCYFFDLFNGCVLRQTKWLILSLAVPQKQQFSFYKGQGVQWTNGYCISAKSGQNKIGIVQENVGNSIALLQRMRTKPWLSLFALCCCCLFLPVCCVFFVFLLWFFLLSAVPLAALCSFIACCACLGVFALPILLLIFKLKGVLLESNRNTAQLCCGME